MPTYTERCTVDFRTATDRAAPCVGHQELADELGVSVQSIRAARLDPGSPNFRNAPGGWQRALAKLLRRHSRDHTALAEELERDPAARG